MIEDEVNEIAYSELLDELFTCFMEKKPVSYDLYNKFRDFQMIAVSDHRQALKNIKETLAYEDIFNRNVDSLIEAQLNQTWTEGEKEDETF